MSGTIKDLIHNSNYKTWLADIKNRVRNAQLKASVRVNTEMLELYWDIGTDIIIKQAQTKWGDGLLIQLGKDLTAEFPGIRGFSRSNLKYMRQWCRFYFNNSAIGQQAVGQLAKQPVGQLGQQAVALLAPPAPAQILQIPWGHNIVIITKCKDLNEALYYAAETLANGWSRSTLRCQIEGRLYKRSGKVDDLMRHPDDKPSIGLILCKSKERVIAEYALRDISKPIGIANWRTKLVASLPTEQKANCRQLKK